MSRRTRLLAPLALAWTLTLAPPPSPALAQNPAAEPAGGGEAESKGRPLDGYIFTALLASLAIFVVCKSSRR
jgi:hypothetical protein